MDSVTTESVMQSVLDFVAGELPNFVMLLVVKSDGSLLSNSPLVNDIAEVVIENLAVDSMLLSRKHLRNLDLAANPEFQIPVPSLLDVFDAVVVDVFELLFRIAALQVENAFAVLRAVENIP